ncbi:hypothetical protein Tco_0709923 [Tanacetum coccineum]
MSKEEHEVHVKLVLESLRKEKLYAKLSSPLTSLTERNQKYEWSVEQEEAFQTLKNDLCDTLIKRISPVLWAEIRGSNLSGPELVQETTDKLVVIKEKLHVARDHQKSYADSGRKMTEYERIGPAAYRLRFLEELIGVHDTFYVSNLKKCLGNANLHVPLNEIKIDKTLRLLGNL